MKTLNVMKTTKNKLRTVALVASLASLLTACTKNGSITSSSSSSISGILGVSLVYPTASGATWTAVTQNSRTYIKGLSITVTGTCSRGIATIAANEGGSNYPETAICQDDGSFTWSKTYASGTGEGDKTLNFVGLGIDGSQVTGATATEAVRIDNTPPAVPVVTDPGTNPLVYNAGALTYTIVGTCSADTVSITGPNGTVITPSGNSWSYVATLVQGATTNYTFYANDFAGNMSAGYVQAIQFLPTFDLKISSLSSGVQVKDSTSGMMLESTVQENNAGFGSVGSGSTIIDYFWGLNSIISQERAN